MIVIEGADNLGKTTLAKKIVKRVAEIGLPVVYSWMGRPNEDKFDFFHAYKQMLNPCAVQDRFHLGGLAWHKNKISTAHLQIINAWIRSVGGLIVVLYAGDEEWYREYITQDTRGNLLSIEAMCKGNLFFRNYAKYGDCNFAFDTAPMETIPNRGFPYFADDFDIDEIVDEWLTRRRDLGLGDI